MKELKSVLSSKRFENLTVKTINKLDYICNTSYKTRTDERRFSAVYIARETPCKSAADFLYAIEHYKDSLCEDEKYIFTDDKYDNVSFFTICLELKEGKEKEFYNTLSELFSKDDKFKKAFDFYKENYNIYAADYRTKITDKYRIEYLFAMNECEISLQFNMDLNLKDFTCESFTAFVDAIYEVFRIAQNYKND